MKIKELYQSNKTLIRNILLYGVIGGLAAAVDFGTFFLFHSLLGMNKFVANLISMHIGMLVSFSLNAKINFKKTDKLLRRFLSYYAIVLCGMAVSTFILWLGALVTDSETIVKLFAVILVAGIQFLLNKLITFHI